MNNPEADSIPLNLVAEQADDQVAYAGASGRKSARAYQSEAELEKRFIADLQEQGYERLLLPRGAVAIEELLLVNLRSKLEKLNAAKLAGGVFTDDEWARLGRDHLLNPKHSFVDRARILREPFSFMLDSGSQPNLLLLSPDPNGNSYQVTSQVENQSGHHTNRYDVTVLVNGLPLLHIELKRRGISIEEAFKQINRYHRDSFWASTDKTRAGLYSWVQLFVGSNGTTTRYWSNTVKELSRKNQAGEDIYRTKTPGFEFTARWAHRDNKNIHDLGEFAQTFMDRRRLGRVLYDYCVIDTNNVMKVLRPYQVYAVEAALERAKQRDPKVLGTLSAGGYIWHTTGSGKTLTSFVLARILAREHKGNSKVLFVVDRQDLDTQTKREFNTFAPDSVDGNKNTAELQKQLLDPTKKIIVTTIQKLATLTKRARKDKRVAQALQAVTKEEVVIIYDECHRSQFGQSHAAIKRLFSRHRIFGFTGTPIFPENAQPRSRVERGKDEAVLATTEALFGNCLHAYTIVNAIDDQNVLKLKIDTQEVGGNEQEYYEHPDRVRSIVRHVVNNHDRLTHRRAFNAIFAASSVRMADAYYRAFRDHNQELAELRAQAKTEGDKAALASIPKPLRVATVYTYAANSEQEQTGDLNSLDDEDLDRADNMFAGDRDNLAQAMADYNHSHETNFALSDFAAYKDHVAERMKSHRSATGDRPFEIDVLIVVNMFLTGFDAPTLNTLHLDKDLRMHGLIQALSRPNRILNSQKSHGEIVCYRDLRNQVDEALRLFGQEQAGEIVLLPGYDDCRKAVVEAIGEVQKLGTPGEILDFKRERDKKTFVKAWTRYLRTLNTISTFGSYEAELVGEAKLADRDIQDYSSAYHDLHEQFSENGDFGGEEADDLDDESVIFDITLLKTIEVNIDYILDLIGELINAGYDEDERLRIRADIERHIGASATLREKRKLINDFIDSVIEQEAAVDNIYQVFQAFVRERSQKNLRLVTTQYGLDLDKTMDFLNSCLNQKEFLVSGQNVTGLKLESKRLGFFSAARDVWKLEVEQALELIHNELVGIVDAVS